MNPGQTDGDDKRYTLEEARRELARAECAAHGHSWDVVQTFGGVPTALVCDRCDVSYRVEAPKSGD